MLWKDVKPIKYTGSQSSYSTPVLDAIISTWYDEDVIEAVVSNCFNNGCRHVYILDNDSPDHTVQKAETVGAKIAHIYFTSDYDDDYRCILQNKFVRLKVEEEQLPTHWWLLLDSDEFPIGDNGEPLLEKISTTSPEIDCVGASCIDLYPSPTEEYIMGKHPANCFQLGMNRRGDLIRQESCSHWKHPLIQYHNGEYLISTCRGNHIPSVPISRDVVEASWSMTLFHGPIRGKEHTQKRLSALCATGRYDRFDNTINGYGASHRFNSLEAIYQGRWQDVDMAHAQLFGRPIRGLALYPWRMLHPNLAVICIRD